MDKTMKFWQLLLSNLAVGIITGLTVLAFTRHGAKIDKNDEVIKSKADIVYVDKQDAVIINTISDHKVEAKQKDDAILELIKSMDRKIDILIQKK